MPKTPHYVTPPKTTAPLTLKWPVPSQYLSHLDSSVLSSLEVMLSSLEVSGIFYFFFFCNAMWHLGS